MSLPAQLGIVSSAAHDEARWRTLLRRCFDTAVEAVHPQRCVAAHLPPPVAGKTLVLGLGKAAAAMAKVAVDAMDGDVEAMVLTRYGHSYPLAEMPAGVMVFEAGHPLPDQHGLKATQRIVSAVRALGEDDQLLALVSGGTSALLVAPAPGIGLDDVKKITRDLLSSGASISEINCVRTHLSAVAGGRLALAAHPARVVTLVLSDVPGDDPALVGSGPTVADRSTLAHARRILEIHRIPVSAAVQATLSDSANESPSSSSPALTGITTRVVGSAATALKAAASLGEQAGYRAVFLGSDLEGDATELGVVHAALALHFAAKGGRWLLLSGGETTVTVRNPNGRGGRNGEYLASLALALDGAPGIAAIACDTDGIDGTEDNAGGLITPSTLARAAAINACAKSALDRNESFAFFEALGDLVMTGPTGTNVSDFRAILIERQ